MGWTPPPLPEDEDARLSALRALDLLDSPPEAEFDAVVRAAAQICNVPIALVSLVDANRQWFKARVGFPVAETPREFSMCAYTILGDSLMEVPDASADPRFENHPFHVGEPNLTFYAGVPLRLQGGPNLGALCVLDTVPRRLSDAQREALESLASHVVRLIELRRASRVRPRSRRADATSAVDLGDAVQPIERFAYSKPALVLALLLGAASIVASFRVQAAADRAIRLRLAHGSMRVERFVAERTNAYGQILRGASALFASSDHVDHEEFRAYVEALELDRNFPGVLGIGFTRHVRREDLAAFESKMRASQPSFSVHDVGAEGDLAIVTYLEPAARNREALGADIASEPRRAAAIANAARTNEVTVSERVVLHQDRYGGPGFLFLLPAHDERGERIGWVVAVVRGAGLVNGIEREAGAGVVVRVRDDVNTEPLLGPSQLPTGLRVSAAIPVADRRFDLDVVAGPDFATSAERSQPYIVLVLGLATTALSLGLVGLLRSIESRSRLIAQQMTLALRRTARDLRDLVDGTSDLIVTLDAGGAITLTNRAFRDLLGHDDAVARGTDLRDLVASHSVADFDATLAELRAGASSRVIETTFMSREGLELDVEGALVCDADEPGVIRAIFRDVSIRKHSERALRSANETLERLANVDSLTGLANRRRFDERLDEELGRVRRGGGVVSLVLLDVDYFKTFNDTYGHPAGDECLRRVASVLRTFTRRAGEVAARYGGEEFAMILPGTPHDGALEAAEHFRAAVAALAIPHALNPAGHVTVSLGVATVEGADSVDHATVVEAADSALYRAKSGGRNRVES